MATHRVTTTDPKLLEFAAWHIDPDGWKDGYTPEQRLQIDRAVQRTGPASGLLGCGDRRVACPQVAPYGNPERMEMRPLDVELRAGASAAGVVVACVVIALAGLWVADHAVDAVTTWSVQMGWLR